MIRLTQSESANDKKDKDSSSQDESATTVKKEANAEPVTPQGSDPATSGKKKNTITSIKIST